MRSRVIEMKPSRLFTLASACLTLLLASCASRNPSDTTAGSPAKFVNPYPPGSYEHFKADPSYPKTYNVWKNNELLSLTNPDNSRIVLLLATQRGLLINGDEVVMDYPICSGTESRPTPPGQYQVLEKVVDKSSNKYGRIYDAEGNLVNGDADSTKDPIPEGGKFVGAPMRYWMRMTWDGVGHHIGPVRRYPASHACVRGPSGTMPTVYAKVKLGTPILVE
jgi:hypothetical protein